jgi:predicted RNA-binding Zn-ribbon protein involved in translation (DUF1610 family)
MQLTGVGWVPFQQASHARVLDGRNALKTNHNEHYNLLFIRLCMGKMRHRTEMRCPKCNEKSVYSPRGKIRGQRFATCENCGFKSPTHRGSDEWIYENE